MNLLMIDKSLIKLLYMIVHLKKKQHTITEKDNVNDIIFDTFCRIHRFL